VSGVLAGKTALVTGSSAGLGEGIALRLAEDGAQVCLHGRNMERLAAARDRVAAATGGTVHAVAGDLSTNDGAEAVGRNVLAAMGGIDILVNNAGGESAGNGTSEWLDVSPEEWVATYNSNVASMVRMIRTAVPGMRERGWGRLIQLSSQSVDTPMPTIPDYQSAKSAIRALTRSLAKALAGTGITANSVSPGLTHSTNTDEWIRWMLSQQGWDGNAAEFDAKSDELMGHNFVGRVGQPADIAHAVAFLADPRAGMVNAIDILVDGGH